MSNTARYLSFASGRTPIPWLTWATCGDTRQVMLINHQRRKIDLVNCCYHMYEPINISMYDHLTWKYFYTVMLHHWERLTDLTVN